MPTLPPMMGRVALERHPNMPSLSFQVRNEPNLENHEQLGQFLPRTQWPNPDIAVPRRAGRLLRTDEIDWNDPDQVQSLHNKVMALYPGLTAMPPFSNATNTYDDTQWLTHVAFMHGVLTRDIAGCEPLEDLGMCALLRTISYGMYHTMTFFQPWRVTGLIARARTRQSGSRYQNLHATEFGIDMKSGTFQAAGLTSQDYKDRMMGRRWIVAPIKYEQQWGMTIFDRQKGHLYIFDCDSPEDREERVEACTHLWARFWNWLDMPWSFLYFVPAATQRSGLRDSGLAAAMWVMLNLRNQVGTFMEPNNATAMQRDILILPLDPNLVIEQSGLPLHDWVPDGCSNSQLGMQGVETMLRVVICNELGLRNNPHIRAPFGIQQPKRPIELLDAAATYMFNNTGFPANEFWTGNGGPQFSLPQRSGILRYPGQGARSHRKPAGNNRVRIRKDHRELTRRHQSAPQQPIVWPQGNGYTHNQPFARPANGVRPMVTSIDELDEESTEEARRIRVSLRNALSAAGHQVIETPLDLKIRDHQLVTQSNGVQALRFNIDVWFGGDDPMTLPFSMPLPEEEDEVEDDANDDDAQDDAQDDANEDANEDDADNS